MCVIRSIRQCNQRYRCVWFSIIGWFLHVSLLQVDFTTRCAFPRLTSLPVLDKVRGPSQLDDRGNVVHGRTKLKVRHSKKITSENILEDNEDSAELFSGYDYKVGLFVSHVGLTAAFCAVMVFFHGTTRRVHVCV